MKEYATYKSTSHKDVISKKNWMRAGVQQGASTDMAFESGDHSISHHKRLVTMTLIPRLLQAWRVLIADSKLDVKAADSKLDVKATTEACRGTVHCS